MLVQFTLRCALCERFRFPHLVDIDLAPDFVDEVEAGQVECTAPRCAEARSYGVGTMKIVGGPTILAREVGDHLHSMTQSHHDWITEGHNPF